MANSYATREEATAVLIKDGWKWNAQNKRFEKVHYTYKALHWRYVTQCKGGRWIITRA